MPSQMPRVWVLCVLEKRGTGPSPCLLQGTSLQLWPLYLRIPGIATGDKWLQSKAALRVQTRQPRLPASQQWAVGGGRVAGWGLLTLPGSPSTLSLPQGSPLPLTQGDSPASECQALEGVQGLLLSGLCHLPSSAPGTYSHSHSTSVRTFSGPGSV